MSLLLAVPSLKSGKKAVCAHEQRSALGADDARACGGSLKAVSMQCLLVLKVKRLEAPAPQVEVKRDAMPD